MCVFFTSDPERLERDRIVFKVVRYFSGKFLSLYNPDDRIAQNGPDTGDLFIYALNERNEAPFEDKFGFYTYPNLQSLRRNGRRFLRQSLGAYPSTSISKYYEDCSEDSTDYICLLCIVPKGSRVRWGSMRNDPDKPNVERKHMTLNAESLIPIRVLPQFNEKFCWGDIELD